MVLPNFLGTSLAAGPYSGLALKLVEKGTVTIQSAQLFRWRHPSFRPGQKLKLKEALTSKLLCAIQ